jgi:Uma2 family endonuclease
MSQRLRQSGIDITAYLRGEREATVRHEYVDGQVYAMAGASDRHNRIAGNVFARCLQHLREGPCEPFISDMKLYIAPNLFYYPDVMVTCDTPGGDPYFRTQSVLLVEVLSPATERVDRNEKLRAYQNIPTLKEYLIISQDQALIELHRRTMDGWFSEEYDADDDEITFDSIGLTLTVAEIYRGVPFDS